MTSLLLANILQHSPFMKKTEVLFFIAFVRQNAFARSGFRIDFRSANML